MNEHPDFTVEKMERFWPHKQDGEGHFVAKLVRRGRTSVRSRCLSTGKIRCFVRRYKRKKESHQVNAQVRKNKRSTIKEAGEFPKIIWNY